MYTQGINFFKYITPMACSDRLKIPLAHRWNTNKAFPNEVILKDTKGNTWPVKLKKVENQVCFIDAGWLKFVKDNRIEPGYFLTFENDVADNNVNVFSFLVFDPVTTKCIKHPSVPSDHVPSFELSSSSLNDSVNEDEETTSMELTEEVDNEEEETEYEEEEEEEEEVVPIALCIGNTSIERVEKKRSKTTKDIYGSEIFRSEVIPKPNNPYFVSCIKSHRQNELHVPANVIKDFKLNLPEKAKIRDKQGLEWETELKKWKDGRLIYYGGLISFYRVNHVRDDDRFVCEFLYGDGAVQQDLTLYLYKV